MLLLNMQVKGAFVAESFLTEGVGTLKVPLYLIGVAPEMFLPFLLVHFTAAFEVKPEMVELGAGLGEFESQLRIGSSEVMNKLPVVQIRIILGDIGVDDGQVECGVTMWV